MNSKLQRHNHSRNVALCYIRQSWTRDSNDTNSPERQRANIQAVCEEHGWTPEWYEDAEGHKSGTKEKNRPGWLALKQRLADPDIIALIANDLSRFHRKGWRVGKLLDLVQEYHLHLVLAGRGKHVDCSTPQGRAMAQLSAMFDEWYADDIAQRSRDSVAYRKKRGITVGIPPFGTIRDSHGNLQGSLEGVWILPDGSIESGIANQPLSEEENAIWRGYYDAAAEVLKIYAEDRIGHKMIAKEMNRNHWFYRDRKGNPVPFKDDDVRRIVALWQTYGGLVTDGKAKSKHPFEDDLDEITLDPDKAVFAVDLLMQVGYVRRQRTRKPMNRGHAVENYPYPLAGLLYCAHCEREARLAKNPKLRTRLGGKTQDTYRHRGRDCGCRKKSVKREIIEDDFKHLIDLLVIKPEWEPIMLEISLTADGIPDIDEENFATRKSFELQTRKTKRERVIELYMDGFIDKEKMESQISQLDTEIKIWSAKTSDKEQVEIELRVCADALRNIKTVWERGDDEDRQGLAQHLIEEITYDLERKEIVDIKLKDWVEKFVQLRFALHKFQEDGTNMTPTGLEPVSSP